MGVLANPVPSMIDHISIPVRVLAVSGAFYEAVLAPLGMRRLVAREQSLGFGKRYPEFWLNARPDMTRIPPDTGSHICLRARSEEAVRASFEAALIAGGQNDGLPSPRQAAMTPYYGAFFRDPDGNKIEVVTFPAPE